MILLVDERMGRLNRNGFRDIVEALQSRIFEGLIPPGRFLGTERELQEEFGAGRSTIRKVLSELVKEGWAVSVPKKGVFAGTGLTPTRSRSVAFLENGTFVQKKLAKRFHSGCQAQELQLVQIGGAPDYPFPYALQRVMDGDFAGVLVWCFDAWPSQELAYRLASEVPVVALDHRLGKVDTDVVTFDHESAAYHLTRHLIDQGCRKIGLTGMLDTLDITGARIQGYMRALFDHGLRPDPADYQFILTSGMTTCQTGALEARLRCGDRPDGLIILQDSCAAPTVEAALRSGLSLPNDLKLAAIGDDHSVSVDGLGMTSISFDWMALGDLALELLADRLQDLHRPNLTRFAPYRLVVRGLSGAPNDQWTEMASPEPSVEGLEADRPTYSYQSIWRPTTGTPIRPNQ